MQNWRIYAPPSKLSGLSFRGSYTLASIPGQGITPLQAADTGRLRTLQLHRTEATISATGGRDLKSSDVMIYDFFFAAFEWALGEVLFAEPFTSCASVITTSVTGTSLI